MNFIHIIYFAVPQVHNTIAKCGITFKSKLNVTMLIEIQLLLYALLYTHNQMVNFIGQGAWINFSELI